MNVKIDRFDLISMVSLSLSLLSSLANSSGYMRGVVGENKKRPDGKIVVGATVGQIMLFSGLSLVLNKAGL